MNKNNKIVAIVAVIIIIIASIGVTYVLTQDNGSSDARTISYDANGGTGSLASETGKTSDITLLPTTNPSHDAEDGADIIFIGWSTSKVPIIDNGGTVPILLGAVITDSDTTVYAVWAYDRNGDGTPDFYDSKYSITDARGRTIEVPEINSIYAIHSCSLELVSFFDAVSKVNWYDSSKGSSNGGESFTDPGRTHSFIMAYDNPQVLNLPPVDCDDIEAVIAASPSIIISSTVSVSDLNTYQSKAKIPVFAINADVEFDSSIMYSQILALGMLFGEQSRAQELIDGILSFIGNISDNAQHADETAYACGMMYYGAGTFLKTSGNYLPFVYSNVENVYPPVFGGQPYNTDLETLISKNPGVIFMDGSSINVSKQFIEDNMETLSYTDAIKNGKVYQTLVYKDWGTNWVNQLINVYYVADIMHPGEFGDFEDNANNIIQLFYPGTSVTYDVLANAQTYGGCQQVQL